ncbi:MAG: hypothetical protein EXQ86_10880 [Rhodospirillales bacterium]|nr:hypothetical protein [Rhodospirillales bacterium]
MKKAALLVIALVVGACSNRTEVATAQAVGTAFGAAAGGAIGYSLGTGKGQLFLTTAGALFGAAAGYRYGPRLIGSDRFVYDRAAQQALAELPDGDMATWSNPDTGNRGMFRPTRSYVEATGGLCRQYRTTVAFRDGVESGNGIACRHSDGGWTLVEDHFG